jgi:hypothetical protein
VEHSGAAASKANGKNGGNPLKPQSGPQAANPKASPRPTHKTGFKLFYAQRSRVNAFFYQFTSFIFKFLSVAPSKHPLGMVGFMQSPWLLMMKF